MKCAHIYDESVYEAVISGELIIKPDGTIWRTSFRQGSPWSKALRVIKCQLRRAENRSKDYYTVARTDRSGNRIKTGAHRLVYRHFKGKIPPGITVNHNNGIKHDNRPDNLSLATYREQYEHAKNILGTIKPLRGEDCPTSKLTEKQAREIIRLRSRGSNIYKLAKHFSVRASTISRIANGVRWSFLTNESKST